jgi:phosphohistidine phosphatase
MLQLTLIRHAKSNWGDPKLKDIDRPLNSRGLQDAPLMGDILNEKLAIFDHLISSPAKRAITTSKLLAKKLGHPEKDIKQEQQLYNASLQTLLNIIHKLDGTVKHCVLVAHNPGLSLLADHLDSGQTGDLPTCAVVSFTFEVNDWQAIGRGNGKLVLFEYPKKYS